MNSMSKPQKIVCALAYLASGLMGTVAHHLWGGGASVAFVLFAGVVVTIIYSSHEVTTLYWRKQVWRCDICQDIIDKESNVIITCRLGGRLRRYDSAICMETGLKENT